MVVVRLDTAVLFRGRPHIIGERCGLAGLERIVMDDAGLHELILLRFPTSRRGLFWVVGIGEEKDPRPIFNAGYRVRGVRIDVQGEGILAGALLT